MYICPRCGANEGGKKFIGPFCIDCATFRIEAPSKMSVSRCKRCGKMLISGKWMQISDKKLAEHFAGRFRGEFTSAEFFPEEQKAVFVIEKAGEKIRIEKHVELEILPSICPDCNRMAGGYFEAIIQLRGSEARVAKYARIFQERLEEAETFISKVVEDKNGLDLYVGSTRKVLSVIKDLGLKYKISTSLAGQKQGKRLYRSTFAIRFE